MKSRSYLLPTAIFALFLLLASGCSTTTQVRNMPSSRPTKYVPVDTPTLGGGTGIESQDIVAMTDQMMRDMLQNPILVRPGQPRVVVVDDKFFENRTNQRLKKSMIVDRLRINLHRAANGRMRFIARHAANMFEHEQMLRQEGAVRGQSQVMSGADYRLTGNFQNLASGSAITGDRSNYVQVIFEMVDLNTAELVWAGLYEFKKVGRESVLYQ